MAKGVDSVEVEVTNVSTDVTQAVVTDRDKGRAWSGEGKNASEATTEAVKKFLGDRNSAEYVRRNS